MRVYGSRVPDGLKITMPRRHKIQFEKRAEIAGRMLLKRYNESSRSLGDEYGVDNATVLNMRKEFEIRPESREQAKRAALLYYNANPLPVQLAASNHAIKGNDATPHARPTVDYSDIRPTLLLYQRVLVLHSFLSPMTNFWRLLAGLLCWKRWEQ